MMLPDGPVLTRGQSVYVMHVPALGYFKVGRASNPTNRISQLQTGCPEIIELVGASDIDEAGIPAEAFEMALHRALHPYRSHGEWFAKINYEQITTEWQRVWNDLVSRSDIAVPPYTPERMYVAIMEARAEAWTEAWSGKDVSSALQLCDEEEAEILPSWYRRQKGKK